jgi:hypothetical protein
MMYSFGKAMPALISWGSSIRNSQSSGQQDQLHQRDSSREQINARFRINIIPTLGAKPLDVVER